MNVRLTIVIASFLVVFALMISCCNCGRLQGEERARIAQMEAELQTLQVGDFLEFEDGSLCLVVHLLDKGCRYASPVLGQSPRNYYRDMAHYVIKIHKFGEADWNQAAARYCTPPYNS